MMSALHPKLRKLDRGNLAAKTGRHQRNMEIKHPGPSPDVEYR